jgi:hypothetical protein
VAAVGRDDIVRFGDSVLDACGDGFLAGRQVAEAADLLLFVQSVGGHFHAADVCEYGVVRGEEDGSKGVSNVLTVWLPCRSTSASAPSSWC